MEPNKAAGTADLWYVDNYILLKDYYDRTISRIAARCVRKGNIAIEDYLFSDTYLTFWKKSAKPANTYCSTGNCTRMSNAKSPAG